MGLNLINAVNNKFCTKARFESTLAKNEKHPSDYKEVLLVTLLTSDQFSRFSKLIGLLAHNEFITASKTFIFFKFLVKSLQRTRDI